MSLWLHRQWHISPQLLWLGILSLFSVATYAIHKKLSIHHPLCSSMWSHISQALQTWHWEAIVLIFFSRQTTVYHSSLNPCYSMEPLVFKKVNASLCLLPRPLNSLLSSVGVEEFSKNLCYTPGPPKVLPRNLLPCSILWRTEAQKVPVKGREISFPFLKTPPIFMSYRFGFPFT